MKMKTTMLPEMMINKILKTICIIAGSFIFVCSNSQNDFESWNSIDFQYSFSKKFDIVASNEIRLNNNAQNFRKYQIDLGGDYEFIKNFQISLYYRYSRIDDQEAYLNEHLVFGKIGFTHKVNRFEIDLQTRFDRAYELYGMGTLVKTGNTWRNKIAISYNIYGIALTPYASYEYFIAESKYSVFEPNKHRIFGGFKYKINRNNSVGAFYGIQKSLLKSENSYILGLKYGIKLN